MALTDYILDKNVKTWITLNRPMIFLIQDRYFYMEPQIKLFKVKKKSLTR